MNEKYGAVWHDQSHAGWRAIYERHNATTDLVAAVLQHDGLRAIKAEVFRKVYVEDLELNFWEQVRNAEALFDDCSEAAAIAHVEAFISHS